jgi:murein tripeptide amidase MpaA
MRIDSSFEGGRIEVVGVAAARHGTEPVVAHLEIPPDVNAPRFRQWFFFELRDAPAGRPVRLRFENISACTWADAFGGHYRVHAAYDGEPWFRLPSRVDGKVLVADVTPRRAMLKIAYHPPYDTPRLRRLLSRLRPVPGMSVAELGRAESGHALHLVTTPDAPASAPVVWVIAQQHPGEHMAGWFVEGLLDALAADACAPLRRRARFNVVPRMNPGGWAVGNHRTSAAGIDLNRQWERTSRLAPEVRLVKAAMAEGRGVDVFLDVHGDERLPYVFVQRPDDHPGRPARFTAAENLFNRAMLEHAPDFQTEHSYVYRRIEFPFLALAANWVQHAFDCLALTLEMPFSDNALAPREEGWSPERSRRLGAQTLAAIDSALDDLAT